MELNLSCENLLKSSRASAGILSLSEIITLALLKFVSILNLMYLGVFAGSGHEK